MDFLDSCGVHWSKSVVNFNDNDDVDDGDDDGDGVKRRCCKNGDGGSGDVSGVIHRGQPTRRGGKEQRQCDDDDGGDIGDDDVDDGDADDHGPKLQNVKYNVIMWTSEKI